ncbi:DUF748 domain-containing protein [Glaciimonas immobilis]|uniref:DUF748 domain-containing protein n=1 Tax=Glaciimonas immobilis TaxID=728004 RepID=A0A840RUX0_9BURK|nr:DUF748 domain-containing protein [Glaciimonas immobilis]KAF3999832.1 DUF748 domain-containing protein [Glaciimonas immobilis]MBB5200310.1 hypothetical protein [Glaciimonas immobilis]
MITSKRPIWLLRTVRWTIYTVTALVFLAALSWLAVPLTKHPAEQQIAEQLGRKASIGALGFNPFTLTLSVADFTLYEADKITPAASVKSLLVDASITSLFRLAPVLQQVTLSKPEVHVIRVSAEGSGRYNFSDIIDRILAKPKSTGETHFSVANIRLENGTIKFDDTVTGKQVNITALNIGLPYISNFQSAVNVFVQPSLSMNVNGAPFALKGRTKPFANSLDTTLAIDIDHLDVASYVAFSPLPLPVTIQSSTLSTNLDLTFVRTNDKPEINLSGDISLGDVALADKHTAPLFKAHSIDAHINKFNVLTVSADIRKIDIQAPEVWAALSADGTLNWATLATSPSSNTTAAVSHKKVTSTSVPATSVPQFAMDQLTVHDGIINWADAKNASPAFNTQLKNVSLVVQNLSLAANAKPAAITLSTGAEGTQQIRFKGQVTPAAAIVNGEASIAALPLALYQPYLNNALAANLSGDLSIKTLVAVNSGNVVLTQLNAELSDAKIAAKSSAIGGVQIKKITLHDAKIDTETRTFRAAAFDVAGLQADVRRDANGNINLQQFIKTSGAASKAPKASTTKSATPDWIATLNSTAITDSTFIYSDKSVMPAVNLRADVVNLKLDNLSTKRDTTVKIALATRLNKSGKLSIDGNAAPQYRSLDLAIDGQNLPIAALQPYFTELLNVTLSSGFGSTKGKLHLTPAAGKKAMSAGYKGMLSLTKFKIIDKQNGADFLNWKSLDINGIDANIDGSAQNINLGKIAIDDFYARAILSPEGRLNLQDIVVSKAGKTLVVSEPATISGPKKSTVPAAEVAVAAEAKAPVAPPTSPTTPPDPNSAVFRIGQVIVKNGNVNFTDNFIKPNYTANMTGMSGSIGAVASDKPAPAAIDLTGKIDNDAPVAISGSLNPLFQPVFLDIKASADGVELPGLTPYAAKYAGYAIVKGKLSMDVNYKVEEQQLTAQNHVRIDQLTFGDKIDSPSATKLPVRLAVALLKDRNGQIDINLPISGSLSDPQFSVGGIILRVFVNLIAKAVTSPFALLSSAFGGGDELGYAEFRPGSAILTTPTKVKLDTLTKALLDRPALKLDIIGRVDPVADDVGLRQDALDKKIIVLKQKNTDGKTKPSAEAEDVAANTDTGALAPEPTAIALTEADKTQYMEKVYKSEKFDKPKNVIGFAKSLPAPEMEQLILTNTKVTTDDLRSLADRRARAVRNYLETKGKIPLERIFLIAPKLSADGIKDKATPSRVDFALR